MKLEISFIITLLAVLSASLILYLSFVFGILFLADVILMLLVCLEIERR